MIGCGCGSLKGARKEASLLGRLPPSSQRAVAEWSGAGVDGAEWSGADVDGETACASCLRLVCFEKRRAASRPEIIPRSGSTTVSGQTDPDRSAAAAARAASSRADHRDAMIGCRRATRVVRARETSQRFLSTETLGERSSDSFLSACRHLHSYVMPRIITANLYFDVTQL